LLRNFFTDHKLETCLSERADLMRHPCRRREIESFYFLQPKQQKFSVHQAGAKRTRVAPDSGG
jgi:hypothetical protein